jgi:hypothetical protein
MFVGEIRGGNQGHTGVFFQKRRSPSAEAVRMKSCAPTATKVTTSQCMKLFSYICVFGSSLRAASYSACLCKKGKPWIHLIHIDFAGCARAPGTSSEISKVRHISEHFTCTQREREDPVCILSIMSMQTRTFLESRAIVHPRLQTPRQIIGLTDCIHTPQSQHHCVRWSVRARGKEASKERAPVQQKCSRCGCSRCDLIDAM